MRGRGRSQKAVAFRLLPGGTPAGQIALGSLGGSFGQALTFGRALAKVITTGTGTAAAIASGSPAVGPKGVVIERAATNLCLRSQTFDNAAWTKIGSGTVPVVTQNTGDLNAPDGTATAAKVVYPAVSGGAGYALLRQTIVVTAVAHTASVWMRTLSGTATVFAGISGGNETQCDLTTTWQRFAVTGVLENAGKNFDIGANKFEAGNTDQPAQTIYVWGAQLEVGNHATSYAVTVAASAARPKDSCVYTMPGRCPMTFGTIEFEFTPQATLVEPAFEYLLDYRNAGGSAGDGLTIVRYSTAVFEVQTYQSDAPTVANSAGVTWVAGQTYKIKLVWGGGTTRMYRDGIIMATDSAGTVPQATTRKIGIGSDASGDSQTSGSIQNLKVSF